MSLPRCFLFAVLVPLRCSCSSSFPSALPIARARDLTYDAHYYWQKSFADSPTLGTPLLTLADAVTRLNSELKIVVEIVCVRSPDHARWLERETTTGDEQRTGSCAVGQCYGPIAQRMLETILDNLRKDFWSEILPQFPSRTVYMATIPKIGSFLGTMRGFVKDVQDFVASAVGPPTSSCVNFDSLLALMHAVARRSNVFCSLLHILQLQLELFRFWPEMGWSLPTSSSSPLQNVVFHGDLQHFIPEQSPRTGCIFLESMHSSHCGRRAGRGSCGKGGGG